MGVSDVAAYGSAYIAMIAYINHNIGHGTVGRSCCPAVGISLLQPSLIVIS